MMPYRSFLEIHQWKPEINFPEIIFQEIVFQESGVSFPNWKLISGNAF
jgi:hypothetical protein